MPAPQGKEGRLHRELPGRQTNREGAQCCRDLPDSRRYASVRRRNHEPTAGAVGIGITDTGKAGLGAVVTGLDLEPPAPEAQETLRRAFRASPMLCVRGCEATPESFLRLARAFGTPQRELLGVLRDPAFSEISLVERRQGISTATGKPATFGGHWHTDDSYIWPSPARRPLSRRLAVRIHCPPPPVRLRTCSFPSGAGRELNHFPQAPGARSARLATRHSARRAGARSGPAVRPTLLPPPCRLACATRTMVRWRAWAARASIAACKMKPKR